MRIFVGPSAFIALEGISHCCRCHRASPLLRRSFANDDELGIVAKRAKLLALNRCRIKALGSTVLADTDIASNLPKAWTKRFARKLSRYSGTIFLLPLFDSSCFFFMLSLDAIEPDLLPP